MKELAIKLTNVSKTFKLNKRGNTIRERVFSLFNGDKTRVFKALDNISIEIYKGEFFGIVGHNGSGKSTLVQIMNQTIPADNGGKVDVFGKSMRLALGMGFNVELTGRQNIYINASVLGKRIKEVDEMIDEIVQFAQLEEFIDNPVKFYSSGMKSKLMFSIAIHADSDIFLFDEFFGGVGDKVFKEKADKVFNEQLVDGRTIVLVSHNMKLIQEYCTRVMVLEKGRIVKIGTPDEVLD